MRGDKKSKSVHPNWEELYGGYWKEKVVRCSCDNLQDLAKQKWGKKGSARIHEK